MAGTTAAFGELAPVRVRTIRPRRIQAWREATSSPAGS